jgi:hypothetical protein
MSATRAAFGSRREVISGPTFYWPAVDGLRSQLRTVGRFADDEIDRLRELLRDSNSRWVSATLMSAWGRRPG